MKVLIDITVSMHVTIDVPDDADSDIENKMRPEVEAKVDELILSFDGLIDGVAVSPVCYTASDPNQETEYLTGDL